VLVARYAHARMPTNRAVNALKLFYVKEPRQRFAGSRTNHAVDAIADRRRFRIDFRNECVGIIVCRERGRGIYHGARTDNQNHISARSGEFGFVPNCGRQRFAEPDDIRTPAATARVLDLVERQTGRVERTACVAAIASRFAKFTVQFENARRAGAQMKRIDVLRRERKIGEATFHLGQRAVTGVRFGAFVSGPSLVVPRPHKPRIAREALRRSEFLNTARAPQSAGAAERRQPALGGNARTGQYEDGCRGSQAFEQFSHHTGLRAGARGSLQCARELLDP
jgi:hypothetical protein